jgi:hypothetical protein
MKNVGRFATLTLGGMIVMTPCPPLFYSASGENLLRFRLRQLPEWAAVLVEFCEKGPHLWVNPRVASRIRRLGCC